MTKEPKYKFTKPEPSKGGKFSSILALVSLILFVISVCISWAYEGKAGSSVGGLSFIAMLLSVYGFIVGMKSFGEKDVSPILSIVGSIACGVIMVFWLTLFLTGVR